MLMRYCLLIVMLFLLASCQSAAPLPEAAVASGPAELRAQYQELARKGAVYTVDPVASKVLIYVFRAGAAAKLGHNHVLSVPKFEGYLSLPSPQPSDARFDVGVQLADLVIDDPALRAQTGGGFESQRSADDIEGTRRNMLGERGFQSERFPRMQLRSLAIEGDWPVLIAQVEVTLHGVSRTQLVMLQVARGDGQLRISGEMTLRQSDFGMVPFSALGGLMKVQDAVAVSFSLVAKPATF